MSIKIPGRMTLFAAIILLALAGPAVAGDTVKVPDGVKYKAAAPEINKKAEAKLRQMLAKTPHDFTLLMPGKGKSVTTAGVFLTINTLDKYKDRLQGLVPVNYNIAFGKDVKTTVESYAAIDPGQQAKLAAVLGDTIHVSPDYKIRPMTAEELAMVWYYIGWDINEPIFVVEDKAHKYVFNFDPAGETLFWVEDLSKPCFQLAQQKNEPLTPCLCFTEVSHGNQYETRFKECKEPQATSTPVKSFTDPVTGDRYGGDWRSYVSQPKEGQPKPSAPKMGVKQVVLLTPEGTIAKNIAVEALTDAIKTIDGIVVAATKGEKETFELAIQVTLNPAARPEFKLASNYAGDQNKIEPVLQAVYDALGAHDLPKTKADPVKFELMFDIGAKP